ncbi:MAG TPA: hypothetical protein VF525_01055, partial [Pyrinomonadaceae bacterium]
MRVLLCISVLLMIAAVGAAQPTAGTPQNRAVGVVTAVDAPARRIKIKTDDGRQLTIQLDDVTPLLRVPPGAAGADGAVKTTLAEVAVGERVFARGTLAADGAGFVAQQVVISRVDGAGRAGTDERGRALGGRITALKPETKEITVQARTPDGQGRQVTISAAGPQVRFLRIAPDSLSLKDALPGSFAALQLGDQLRATGERSADGTRFTAEEIVSGSILRVGGTVTGINAAANEITISTPASDKPLVVALGARSQLRRIPAETAAAFERERAQARTGTGGRDAARGTTSGNDTRPDARPRRDGQTMQELFRSLPVVTLADLKRGDAVLVTGTPGADAARLTAIILLTGDAELLTRLQGQQGDARRANM